MPGADGVVFAEHRPLPILRLRQAPQGGPRQIVVLRLQRGADAVEGRGKDATSDTGVLQTLPSGISGPAAMRGMLADSSYMVNLPKIPRLP